MNLLKKITSKLHSKREKTNTKKRKNKMIVLRKKQLVALSLVLLIGAAGYLNYTFENEVADPGAVEVYNEENKKLGEAQMVSTSESKKQETQQENTGGYFSEARLSREIKRDESIDTLLEIVNSAGADSEAKNAAREQIQQITDWMEKEVTIENMIKAKGYKESVVFISENLVSVAVLSEGLNEVDAAVICDIATSISGYSAQKVNIVEAGE